MMNKLTSLALLSLAALPANAFFLMPCWPVSTQRIDPIVEPGLVSAHVHQIAGGNGFAPAMNYSTTQAADCTTCFVKGDKSNYWIPALYIKLGDGTFERVPQVGSASMYYFNEPVRLGPGETMEPFPEGLRMLAGDPDKRSAGTDFASQAINYKCLNYAGTPTDFSGFPTQNCPDGVRAEVTYPSCWDGKNLDSADHKSHMSYPVSDFQSGACPSTHPHHLVTLKVEFIFDTNSFKDQWTGGQQPFVWSTGDPTGYGLHADYMMGWDVTLLTNAVAQCMDEFGVLANCAPFAGQIQSAYVNPGTCSVASFVDEDVGGSVKTMPGCNNLQYGPGEATKETCTDNVSLLGRWANAKTNGMLNWLELGSDNSDTDSAASSSSSPSSATVQAQAPAPATPSTATTPSASAAPAPNEWTPVIPVDGSQVQVAPSPSATQPSTPSESVVTITIDELVTVTSYITEDAATPTPAAQETHTWANWRREIGDNVHKHKLRHIRYRRGTQNRR